MRKIIFVNREYRISVMLLCLLAIMVSCTSESDTLNIANRDNAEHNMRMLLDGSIIQFDDAKSRAGSSAWEWKNGDVIYILFGTDGANMVSGQARYNKADGYWEITYKGTLQSFGSCEVYFFDGSSQPDIGHVDFNGSNGVYNSKKGTYTILDNMVVIYAELSPVTARLRFKGKPGLKVSVSGLSYYKGYTIDINTLVVSSDKVNLQVSNDGYTPYMYCMFSDDTNHRMSIINSTDGDGVVFDRHFDSNALSAGNSRVLTIPTEDTNIGWDILMPNGHEFVDLGLPSGTLWATCNVGSTSPEGLGNYYSWGETAIKERFYDEDYKWYDTNTSTYTKYVLNEDYGVVDNKKELDPEDDVAHVEWGGDWCMPTQDDFMELINNADWTLTERNGVVGYLVENKKKTNSIFLPLAGGRFYSNIEDAGTHGCYWSKSVTNYYGAYYLSLKDQEVYIAGWFRTYGLSVRPVIKK